jgi:hypothetical protein
VLPLLLLHPCLLLVWFDPFDCCDPLTCSASTRARTPGARLLTNSSGSTAMPASCFCSNGVCEQQQQQQQQQQERQGNRNGDRGCGRKGEDAERRQPQQQWRLVVRRTAGAAGWQQAAAACMYIACTCMSRAAAGA